MGNLERWFARISSFSLPFLSSRFLLFTKHSAMHGSCSFYFMTTILSVALDVGYISITKSVVFSRWAIVRHMRSPSTGPFRSASIYGGMWIGGRDTDFFGGLVGLNNEAKIESGFGEVE